MADPATLPPPEVAPVAPVAPPHGEETAAIEAGPSGAD